MDRLIEYIDELVQLNGNKYQWRDWEGVLRKAAREGWGPMKPLGEKTAVKEDRVPEHKPSYDLDEIEELLRGQYARI